MKKEVRQFAILALCLVLAGLICGCVKQQAQNEKQTRLVSAELQRTIAQKDKEIATLKGVIKKCEDEKALLQNKSDDAEKAMGEEAMKMFEDNLKLQEENEALKKQIEELKNK